MKYEKPTIPLKVKVRISPDAPPLHLNEETKRYIARVLDWERRSNLVDRIVGVPPNSKKNNY